MAALSGGGGRAGRGGSANPAGAVQLLIERGADVNAVNSRGMTAMHYAARAGKKVGVRRAALNHSVLQRLAEGFLADEIFKFLGAISPGND